MGGGGGDWGGEVFGFDTRGSVVFVVLLEISFLLLRGSLAISIRFTFSWLRSWGMTRFSGTTLPLDTLQRADAQL